jgi:hypothetical protein
VALILEVLALMLLAEGKAASLLLLDVSGAYDNVSRDLWLLRLVYPQQQLY